MSKTAKQIQNIVKETLCSPALLAWKRENQPENFANCLMYRLTSELVKDPTLTEAMFSQPDMREMVANEIMSVLDKVALNVKQ